MSDWPQPMVLPAITIHPWSLESLGGQGTPLLPSTSFAMNLTSSAAWQSANRAIFVPFVLMSPITVAAMWVLNGGTASGNLDIGVYDQSGTKLVSTGSTAQSGTTAIQVVSVTATRLAPGRFYLALAMDGTTGTVLKLSLTAGYTKHFGIAEMASAFALPGTATFASATTMTNLPAFGLSLKTGI